MKLRRPNETLAGCVWLPRFIDKARHCKAGTLEAEYERPFGHPLATDGVFFSHFQIDKTEILQVIEGSNGDDRVVVRWFEARPQFTGEAVKAWNELAPNIGKKGYPAHRGFLWILQRYYGGTAPDPRVDSVFTAIAYDEGFLDEFAQSPV